MNSSNYILLVEDNQDDIDLTLLALKKNNFKNMVLVARDGNEAIETLKFKAINNGEFPSVVLLDLNMPVMDGFEVLQFIKGQKGIKSIPTVILTSSSETSDVSKGYEMGANSYICKPVAFSDFVTMIQEIGKYWLCTNISPCNDNTSYNVD